MHEMLTLQFDKVIGSFQRSIARIEVASNTPLFKKLRGVVSLNALDHIVKEFAKSTSGVGYDKGRCGCIIRKTHLLPCACELGVYHVSGTPIPLDVVDDHWKNLSLDSIDDKFSQDKSADYDISYQIEMIWARYNHMTVEERFVLKKQLNEIAFPTTSSMVAPRSKVKTKGAPKKKKQKLYDVKRDPSGWEHVDEKMKLTQESGASSKNSSQRSKNSSQRSSSKLSQSVSRILTQQGDTKFNLPSVPHHMHPYVEKIIDVERDGNCGFRAVAVGLDLGEDSWPIIRQDLIRETREREQLYTDMFGKERLAVLRKALSIEYPGFQREEKWLSLPEMGYFIATKYNVALVQFSLGMNFTYLPLRGSYSSSSKYKIISILNVGDIHWMHISISPVCLLPPVALMWTHNRSEESTSWLDPYTGRFSLWQSTAPVMPRLPPIDAPTVVDLAHDSDDLD